MGAEILRIHPKNLLVKQSSVYYAIGITDVTFSSAPQKKTVFPHRTLGAGTKYV